MTPNPIGGGAIAYVGPRVRQREATGPMTRYGRDTSTAHNTDRAPVMPDRP
jgi:hypothetical protein